MPHLLEFDRLIRYDHGLTGITIETTIGFSDVTTTFPRRSIQAQAYAFLKDRTVNRLGLILNQASF